MRYAVTYSAQGQEFCRVETETPVRALHMALDGKVRGFSDIRVTDMATGTDYHVRDFARAHDLSVVEDPIPKLNLAASSGKSLN